MSSRALFEIFSPRALRERLMIDDPALFPLGGGAMAVFVPLV